MLRHPLGAFLLAAALIGLHFQVIGRFAVSPAPHSYGKSFFAFPITHEIQPCQATQTLHFLFEEFR